MPNKPVCLTGKLRILWRLGNNYGRQCSRFIIRSTQGKNGTKHNVKHTPSYIVRLEVDGDVMDTVYIVQVYPPGGGLIVM